MVIKLIVTRKKELTVVDIFYNETIYSGRSNNLSRINIKIRIVKE